MCFADDDVVVGVLRGWEGYQVVTDEKTRRLIGAALLAGPSVWGDGIQMRL